MSYLCKISGHKLTTEYALDSLFLTITDPYHDGIGRSHRLLYCKCERCEKNIYIGKTIDRTTGEKK